MGMHVWRGFSQKEYSFATYPVILPPDLAGIARFYIGKPIIYAFVAFSEAFQLTPQPVPLYFGAAADGYRRLGLENHGATDEAMLHHCSELHIMQAPESEGQRSQIVADLLAAHPTTLNYAQQSFKISKSEIFHLQFASGSGY